MALKLALLDADPRHGRDAAGRAEDAGQGVQAVDGHVVQRPAAGLAPVPRWVDVAENVRAAPHALVFVIVLKGRAGRRPRELAQGAVFDHPANALIGWADHLARRSDQLDIGRGRRANELRGFIRRCRHGLVEVDVLAGLDGGQALREVQPDGGSQCDGVDVRVGQQVRVVLIRALDAVFVGGGLGAARHGVTNGGEGDAVLDIRQAEVRQGGPDADAPRADDSHPEGCCHGVGFLDVFGVLAKLDERIFGGGWRMSCVAGDACRGDWSLWATEVAPTSSQSHPTKTLTCVD